VLTGPSFSREVDTCVVRTCTDPHGYTLEILLLAPDPNVMTLRECVCLFFEDECRFLTIYQQGRNRTFPIRMVISDREEGFCFRFQIEVFCRPPAGLQKGIHYRFLGAQEH
jgi:hypothetical protein